MKKFDVILTYKGYSGAFDEDLFVAASKVIGEPGYSNGSGCGSEGRDHVWYNLTEERAHKLKEALEQIPGRQRTVEIRES